MIAAMMRKCHRAAARARIWACERELASIAAQRANDQAAEALLLVDLSVERRCLQVLVQNEVNEATRRNVRRIKL